MIYQHQLPLNQEPESKRCKVDGTVNNLEQTILVGDKLSDLHINLAQDILKKQFPHLNGLQCTLLQQCMGMGTSGENMEYKNRLQIIHSCGDHWIIASTVNCAGDAINVYDSVYSNTDEETK